MMRFLLSGTLLLVACGVTACASSNPASPTLVGTWQWVTVDGQPAPYDFFIRFYEDGQAVTWPAFHEEGRTSQGCYTIRDNRFFIGLGDEDEPNASIEIEGDEFVLVTDESYVLVYHRLPSDLEPGESPK